MGLGTYKKEEEYAGGRRGIGFAIPPSRGEEEREFSSINDAAGIYDENKVGRPLHDKLFVWGPPSFFLSPLHKLVFIIYIVNINIYDKNPLVLLYILYIVNINIYDKKPLVFIIYIVNINIYDKKP